MKRKIGLATDSYELVNAPWLPMRRRSGAVEQVPPWRVTDRIDGDPFVAFAWSRPDFNGAAHELLIGLLCTAAAPADDEDWQNWWEEPPAPTVLQQRFARIAVAFALDGTGPRFLQDLDLLEGAEERSVTGLLIDAPGANTLRNNADLFVKRAGGAPVMSRAAAAMSLYVLNTYAPTGGAGHRTSLRGGGPLTTLVVASHRDYCDTLWGRLWPNVESAEQVGERSSEAMVSDDMTAIFPWLAPTRTSEKNGGIPTTPADVHPLQVYWGMPRRIRLRFETAHDRLCSLTGAADSVVVTGFHTRNYGTNYSEGFEHPLTPYYRQRAGTMKLPVHPRPGGISYRHWPGIVVSSRDNLRDPAQAIRHLRGRKSLHGRTRISAFGFDMDNMKARAWVDCEMPLWVLPDKTSRRYLESFVIDTTAGADTVSWQLVRAVKSALYDRPSDASGDYGFITDRFYRKTEEAFFESVRMAVALIEEHRDADDPAMGIRERWATILAEEALRLFDEYAPGDALEARNMQRHVKARFFLTLAVTGRGKAGRALYDALRIAPPNTGGRRRITREVT